MMSKIQKGLTIYYVVGFNVVILWAVFMTYYIGLDGVGVTKCKILYKGLCKDILNKVGLEGGRPVKCLHYDIKIVYNGVVQKCPKIKGEFSEESLGYCITFYQLFFVILAVEAVQDWWTETAGKFRCQLENLNVN